MEKEATFLYRIYAHAIELTAYYLGRHNTHKLVQYKRNGCLPTGSLPTRHDWQSNTIHKAAYEDNKPSGCSCIK